MFGKKHIQRLQRRADTLTARIAAARIRDQSEEKAELQSLLWVIRKIKTLT